MHIYAGMLTSDGQADSFDVTAIRAMVKQTRAVISLVVSLHKTIGMSCRLYTRLQLSRGHTTFTELLCTKLAQKKVVTTLT